MRSCILLLALSCVLFTGCQSSPVSVSGMNVQRMGLRDMADASTTVALEVTPDASVQSVQAKTKEIATAISAFLDDGKVSELTIPAITEALKKLVPVEYQFIVDLLIAQVQGVVLPVDKIGVNNVKRLKEVCIGLVIACDRYSLTERPVKAKAPTVPDTKAAVADFGANLKFEFSKRR